MTDTTLEQIEAIELSIADAKTFIEREEALKRLKNNADFKSVIIEGYLKEFAVQLVECRSEPSLQGETQQKAIERSITGVSEFHQFLRQVVAQAAQARSAIEDGQEILAEIEQEMESE